MAVFQRLLMTNNDLGVGDIRPAYCDSCGYDFGIGVDEDDSIIIFCECEWHNPEEFIDDLEEELPLPSSEPKKINKSDSDDTSSKGFQ